MGGNCSIVEKGANELTLNYLRQPYGQVLRRFAAQRQLMESLGLEVDVMWECEWRQIFNSDNRLVQTLKQQHFFQRPNCRLIPREALRGGRVDTYSFFWSSQLHQDEKIVYVDYNSL